MDTLVQPRLSPPHHKAETLSPLLAWSFAVLFAASAAATTRYTLPYLVTVFQDGGNHIVLEMSYAIPRVGMAASGGKRDTVRIEQTISVVDSLGESYHSSWARPTSLPPAGVFGLRKNYVLAQEQIRLPASEFDVHVGVLDLKVESTGSFHYHCQAPGQSDRLDLSDLLLATDIRMAGDKLTTRANLTIQPNPLRLYQLEERVFVYLELYNLERDTFGQTRFEIAYRMERPDEAELKAELFESLERTTDLGEPATGYPYLVPSSHRSGMQVERTWKGEESQTTIATRYIGDTRKDLTFLEFDVSQLSTGIHKLTISATDLQTGTVVEKSVLFRIVGE